MMNGFPRPSTALGLTSENRPADPKQRFWTAPMLHVLGEKASYRSHIFIPGDDALKDAVVTVAGYDISKPDMLPRPLPGSKPQGLRRLIYYAAFYQRGDIANPAAIPLILFQFVHKVTGVVLENDKYKALPNTKAGKKAYRSEWALTEPGVAVAANLRSEFATDGRNVTNVWLNGQINQHNLYTRLINVIKYAPTTCKERDSGEIHDHVGHFLATRIKNDSFATRLGTCDPPTFRDIKTWTLRATYTTFKRRAQDPLYRETRGALTDSEREAGGPTSAAMVASEFSRVFQTTDCIRSEGAVVSEVFVDNGQVARNMHRLDFDRGMNKVREAFQRFKPGNHERIYKIFQHMAEGRTVVEIGELENVTRNRAATLMANTRQALREARQASTDALKVLQYVQENPCSTLEDMVEDIGYVFTPRFKPVAEAKATAKMAKATAKAIPVEDHKVRLVETTASLLDSAIQGWLSTLLSGLVENDRLEAKDFSLRGSGPVTGYIMTDRGQGFILDRDSHNHTGNNLLESLSL